MLSPTVAGLLTGLGLIVAIGAQNAYVLRQGLARDRIGTVVVICAVSDAILIAAGTAGLGALVRDHPAAMLTMKWAGAAYLTWFAVGCFRSARTAGGLSAGVDRARGSVVATTLALTWLNPHVYLDTVLMLGTIANQHGPTGRWWFAGGAAAGSVLWFSALGLGARSLSGVLSRPRTWQVLDTAIGVTMLVIAVFLFRS